MEEIKPSFTNEETLEVTQRGEKYFTRLRTIKEGILSDVLVPPAFDPVTGITPNTLNGNRIIDNTIPNDKLVDNTINDNKIQLGYKLATFAGATISGTTLITPVQLSLKFKNVAATNITYDNYLSSTKKIIYLFAVNNVTLTALTGTELRFEVTALVDSNHIVIGKSQNLHNAVLATSVNTRGISINNTDVSELAFIPSTAPIYIRVNVGMVGYTLSMGIYFYMAINE